MYKLTTGKLNEQQRTPLRVFCTTLWSTPFPIFFSSRFIEYSLVITFKNDSNKTRNLNLNDVHILLRTPPNFLCSLFHKNDHQVLFKLHVSRGFMRTVTRTN
jgi:hypothetical protein